MFEGDSADMCGGTFLLMLMGGQGEGLACADPGARTPIGASGNFTSYSQTCFLSLPAPSFLIHHVSLFCYFLSLSSRHSQPCQLLYGFVSEYFINKEN